MATAIGGGTAAFDGGARQKLVDRFDQAGKVLFVALLFFVGGW